VLDNAPIHCSNGSLSVLDDMLDLYGVKMMFLPKYSPEFNPCELVFGHIKQYLRNRGKNKNFYFDIVQAMAQISIDLMKKYYCHCCK